MKKTNYETKILSRDRNSAESGRSMVEMLGVLAIVGVISVGGIAGYNYGMTRYRTNELLDGASKRAYTIATQDSLGIPFNLSEFAEYDATAGGTFQQAVQQWDGGEFAIQVNGVRQEVCESLIRMKGDNTPLRAITDTEEAELSSGNCADGENNNLYLVYNVEMLSNAAEEGHGYGSNSGGSSTAPASSSVAPLSCNAWEENVGGTCQCTSSKCAAYCASINSYELSSECGPKPEEECGGTGVWLDYGDCNCCNACFTADTMIMLADGTCKRADEITYEDELLVWNFDEGHFDKAKPMWLKEAEITNEYNLIKFSNGAELKTIVDHRIFNREKGEFTYPMLNNEATPVGTHTFTSGGGWVTLESKEVVHEKVVHYNIITEKHFNCFANGILTSCRLNNMYPIKDMKFVKDDRELIPYSVYAELPRRWYEGLRLAEQPVDINRGNAYYHGATMVDYVRGMIRKQQVGGASPLKEVA